MGKVLRIGRAASNRDSFLGKRKRSCFRVWKFLPCAARTGPIRRPILDAFAAACYVGKLRWAYFTRSAPGRQWGRPPQYGPEENRHPGRAPAQPEEHQPRNSAQHPDRHHRAFRLWQIVARLRHDLRRGPAPLRRIALRLRAAVPRPDGAAGSGFHRGPFACDRHRAENHHALAPLDGRHDHRNLRLPARGLQLDRHAALPEMRQAHLAAVHRPDRALHPAGRTGQERRPRDDPRAHRARAEKANTARSWRSWRATASCARASTATFARSTIPRASTNARTTPSKSSSTACW